MPPAAPVHPTYGQITLDGVSYLERPQIFSYQLTVNQTDSEKVFDNQRLTLPGVADFLLKGLSREILVPASVSFPGQFQPGAVVSTDRRFRFRMNNAEGSTWFFSGGLGIFDDRVIDTLCFGSAQFPYMLVPPVPVHSSGSLLFEVEDAFTGGFYPYTIH